MQNAINPHLLSEGIFTVFLLPGTNQRSKLISQMQMGKTFRLEPFDWSLSTGFYDGRDFVHSWAEEGSIGKTFCRWFWAFASPRMSPMEAKLCTSPDSHSRVVRSVP